MFFHGGSLNRGCEAIVRSGVRLIKEGIDNNVTIDLASWNPETDVIIPLIDAIHNDKALTIKKFSWAWIRSDRRDEVKNVPDWPRSTNGFHFDTNWRTELARSIASSDKRPPDRCAYG